MGGTKQLTATVMTCVRNGYTTTPAGYALGGPGPSPNYNNSTYMTLPSFGLPAGSVIDSATLHWDMTDWDWQAAVTISMAAAVGAGTPTNQVATKGTADTTSVPAATLTNTYNALNTARRMLADGTWWLKMYAPNGDNRKNYTSTKAVLTLGYTAPPDGPTLDSATRPSSTQAVLGWTNNASTEAPYTSINVWRSTNGGAASKIASGLAGTTTAYTDNTITAGNFYQYYVEAVNGAGSGLSALSAALYAVPTAPSSVSAHREDTTQNHVTWTDNPTTGAPYTTLTLEYSADGAAWTVISSALAGTTSSYLHTADPTKGYLYRVKATGPGGTSSYGTSSTETIVAPTAPTIGTATRVSDTQNTIAWANHSTTAAPYTALTVERSTDGGAWTQIASVATTATSYTDTTTAANHSYAYRVKGANAAGSATSGTSSTLYNTPAAPSGVTATKTGDTAVTVAWTDNSNTESNFEVQRSTDGGAYSAIGTVAAGVESYNDGNAPGGTLAYKVRAYRGTLYSALSAASNSVTTLQPPAAPTITSAWGPYKPTGTTLRISWQHNTLDGSAQTKADVVYNVGAGDVTVQVTGTTSYYDIPITGKLATQVVTGKVRTYGLYATAGPHSALQSTTLADQPACNITTPAADDAIVTDAPLVVAWSYADEFAQASFTLQLLDGAGALLKTRTGTTETSKEISVADLPDDSSFVLALEVRSGSGFTAAATRSFATDYLGPTVPTIAATWNAATLSVDVHASAGETGELPATDHLALLRIDSHLGVTTTEILADPLTDGSVLTDYLPRLDQTVTYRVLAVAANGAYSSADAQVATVSNGAVALNYGDGYGEVLLLQWDAKLGRQRQDDSETYTFAGRPDPVTFAGEHTEETLNVSALVLDATNAAALEALGEWRRTCTFRQPGGRRVHVKVQKIGETLGDGPGATGAALSLQKVE